MALRECDTFFFGAASSSPSHASGDESAASSACAVPYPASAILGSLSCDSSAWSTSVHAHTRASGARKAPGSAMRSANVSAPACSSDALVSAGSMLRRNLVRSINAADTPRCIMKIAELRRQRDKTLSQQSVDGSSCQLSIVRNDADQIALWLYVSLTWRTATQ